MQQAELLGVSIHCGKKEELIAAARLLCDEGGRIFTVNPLMLMEARENSALFEALSRATLRLPDGQGIRAALSSRGIATDVVCGVELGEYLLSEGGTVGFVGGKQGVAERAFAHLNARYAGLTAAFLLDGYSFTEEQVMSLMAEHRPTFLFVCLGVPRQEVLIDRVSRASEGTLCIGLGGSFDVYAGDKRRAPRLLRSMRLEWLYRMVREPHRLAKLPTLFRYVLLSMKETREIKCTKKRKKPHKI